MCIGGVERGGGASRLEPAEHLDEAHEAAALMAVRQAQHPVQRHARRHVQQQPPAHVPAPRVREPARRRPREHCAGSRRLHARDARPAGPCRKLL